ncbi:microcephalin isoform X2 [Musca autumnalis]
MTLNRTPKSTKKAIENGKVVAGLKENTPSKQLPQTPKANKPTSTTITTPSTNPMLMARIQRDLNSPSASVRVRALKAITSPTKSPYTHFDVPEAEQSLNFSVQETPDIKDVMRNVVVYVEVRSGEDNRSDGVRKVIEALGARVNLKLLRDTTHVVFKDGLMSTFKKAQQWGIPVVSILWIEACKTKNRICDPKDYPISNLDRYENPELYTKMKRYKSMQPDSESSISRKGGSAQRDLTPTQKTGANNKKNSTMIGGTPTSSSNVKKKTDISQYFKKLDNSNSVMTTPISSVFTKKTGVGNVVESPATQLLNRITSNNYTPLMQTKKTLTKTTPATAKNIECYDEGSCEANGSDISKTQKVKKALDFFQTSQSAAEYDNANKEKPTVLPATRTRRRSSILAASMNDEAAAFEDTSMATPSKITGRRSIVANEEAESNTATTNTMRTPNSKNTRRRSSIHTPKNITMETPSKNNQIQPITEEEEITTEELDNKVVGNPTNSSAIRARRTLHVTKEMEISAERSTPISKNAIKENQPKSSSRRRTLNSYAAKNNSSPPSNSSILDTSNITTRRPTCYSVKSMETCSIQNSQNSKELSDDGGKIEKTIELTNQIFNVLMKRNEQPDKGSEISKTKSTNRRRTLYTPKKVSDSTFSKSDSQTSGDGGLCITPTASNMYGKVVACSTLLDDVEKPNKPVATPPANATTGKLLEETTECETPLIFSSTRQPGNKRRTMFDVSMDIITQRLQCINQSARRSLAPTTGIATNEDVKSCITPPSEIVETRKPNNTVGDAENSNSSQCSTNSDTNNVANTTENNDNGGSTPILSKKRKLFIPNEVLTPPPVLTATTKLNTSINTTTPGVQKTLAAATVGSEQKKRRRTLLPLSQTILSTSSSTCDLPSSVDSSSPPSALLKRRSTLDFEQIKKIQNKMSRKNYQAQTADDEKPKKTPGLVYTNMHKEQIDVIREVVNKLSVFNLEQTVTETTTHLVSLEPRRTMNLLRAISRGLWVVDYNWILDSQKAGEWLAEEPYELKNFSRAVEICRSERQAFGDRYKCELFHDLGPFYISIRCYPVTKSDLSELITLCGGRLVLSRDKARYIIGDTNPSLPDKVYVTPYWVLDSISQMQIVKIQKYICPRPGDEKPIPTSPIVIK